MDRRLTKFKNVDYLKEISNMENEILDKFLNLYKGTPEEEYALKLGNQINAMILEIQNNHSNLIKKYFDAFNESNEYYKNETTQLHIELANSIPKDLYVEAVENKKRSQEIISIIDNEIYTRINHFLYKSANADAKGEPTGNYEFVIKELISLRDMIKYRKESIEYKKENLRVYK